MADVAHIKPIPSYPGYFASNEGDIYSNKSGSLKQMKKLVLEDKYGYKVFRTALCYGRGNYKVRLNHRLVAEAWLSDFKSELEVNHKDLNPTNNHVSNLEMVTRIGNVRHAVANGAYARKYVAIRMIDKAGTVYDFSSIKGACLSTGISQGSLSGALCRGYKQCGGYNISYLK